MSMGGLCCFRTMTLGLSSSMDWGGRTPCPRTGRAAVILPQGVLQAAPFCSGSGHLIQESSFVMERARLGSLSPEAGFTPGGSCKSLTYPLDLELKFYGDIRKTPGLLEWPQTLLFLFPFNLQDTGRCLALAPSRGVDGAEEPGGWPSGWEARGPKTGWGGPEGGRGGAWHRVDLRASV